MAISSSTQPSLRARILPRFPANVIAGTGISIIKDGSTYIFSTTISAPAGTPIPVASLPPASSNTGIRRMVNNATATTFWSVVAGGGANIVPVTSDGTNWRIG